MTARASIAARIGQSLWLRLVVWLGATLIAVSTVLLVLVVLFYHQRLSEAQQHTADQIASTLQAALENAMLKRDIPGLQAMIENLAEADHIDSVMILDPQQRVRFASDPAQLDTIITTNEPPHAGMSRALRAVPNRPACHECHGTVTDNPINGYLLIDHADQGIARQALGSALGLIIFGALATLAGSAALMLGLHRMVLRPVQALAEATSRLGAGDLGARVPASGGRDEIARLGEGFNEMAARIEHGHAELARAEAAAQALIDAIPDAIRVIGPDYRIVRANAAYARQRGKPLAEIIGQACYKCSHDREEPCPHTLVTCPLRAFETTREGRLTYRDRQAGPDGQPVSVEVSAAPLDLPTPGCIVEAIRNLDEKAVHSQQERLSEIGLLATGVAHEINNPLSSVELALAAVERDLAAGRSDEVTRYLSLIRDEIGKCLEITGNLLSLGSPSGGRAQLLDIAPPVRATLALLRHEAASRGVTTQTDLPDGLRIVIADADLRMILTNLVQNALHAMPQGGTLWIGARRSEGQIALEVRDSGVGIACRDQEQIFMPFWSRRSDGSDGRGLGLAITRNLVEAAQGQISVRSQPGHGASFTISFPDPDRPT